MTSVIPNEQYDFGLQRICRTQHNHSSQGGAFADRREVRVESLSSMDCEVDAELRCFSVQRDSLTGSQQFMIIQREKHNLRQVTEEICISPTISQEIIPSSFASAKALIEAE
jgi:hypothetical protein